MWDVIGNGHNSVNKNLGRRLTVKEPVLVIDRQLNF